jgi:urocanate hydratase
MAKPSPGSRVEAGGAGGSNQPVRAARGAGLSCQGWLQEAALRMLMNSLDPEVAEQPGNLIACGSTGNVLRDWESFGSTVEILKILMNDETLLVQRGKPAGVVKTRPEAPRVLIMNSNPAARRPISGKMEQQSLALPSQASAASWTYVGTQETLPTAFLVFDALGREHFSGDLTGKLIVSGGMGAAGGALPLAAGMLGAAFLGIDADGERIRRRIRAGYCDYCVNTLDEALRILKNAVRQKQSVSVGLVGNCADVIPELAARGVLPDILTDQTGADNLLNGYFPAGVNAEEAVALRRERPEEYLSRARDSLTRHFEGMVALQKLGSVVFEFGNNIRAAAEECGVAEAASAFPGFAEAYLEPLLSAGLAPVRWVALSGELGDIRRLDDLVLELFPTDALLARWISLARKYVRFQGLPARVSCLGQEARIALARRVNQLVAEGVFKAPVVVALDHASTRAERSKSADPAAEKEEIGAVSNSPALDALISTASGASWLSLEFGSGHSQATVALVADGSPQAAKNRALSLSNDYAVDVLRLAAWAVE